VEFDWWQINPLIGQRVKNMKQQLMILIFCYMIYVSVSIATTCSSQGAVAVASVNLDYDETDVLGGEITEEVHVLGCGPPTDPTPGHKIRYCNFACLNKKYFVQLPQDSRLAALDNSPYMCSKGETDGKNCYCVSLR